MKTRRMHLIAGATMFVLCISICTATSNPSAEGVWEDIPQPLPTIFSSNQVDFVVSQEEAWSDDFDHGNINESGWSVQAYRPAEPPWEIIPTNITADDGTMRGYGPYWNQAWRTSNVAFGSWAFDVHCVGNTPSNRSYIAFISGSPVVYPPDFSTIPFEYGIITCVGQSSHGNHTFILYRRPSHIPYLVHLAEYDVEDASGWWHINITRDYDGDFNVYFNDTLGITVRDTHHTRSDLFSFYADAGYALDNIVVVGYPDVYPPVIDNLIRTPSTPNSTESVLVNVDVTDVSGVDTVILSYNNGAAWSNTTMTWTGSDYEGTIPAFPVGTEVQYRVHAKDTFDNWADSETYNYTVTDSTTTTNIPWDLILIGGSVAVAVIVLAIVVLRRR